MRSPTKRLSFGQTTIDKLKVPKEGRETVYDSATQGLGLRLESNGRKSYFWFRKVNGAPVFKMIGTSDEVTVDQARGKAAEHNANLGKLKLANFEGPNVFKRPRGELTLTGLVDEYVEKNLKPNSKRPERAEKNARWLLGKYLSDWKDFKLSMIHRRDVIELHAKIGKDHGQIVANRVVQFLRALYYFAADQELTEVANPARRIKQFRENSRETFIQPEEMPLFFRALREEPSQNLKDFVLLSLFTGARKSDVMSMRWEDVQPFENNKWSVPDPKSDPYIIALTVEAVQILKDRFKLRIDDNDWVFPSFGDSGHLVDLKKRWRDLLTRSGLTKLRQHDLRRTHASWQAIQGSSLLTIAKSLGHESSAAVTETYAKLNLKPVRQSVNKATRAMIAAGKKKVKALPAAPRG